MFLGPSFHYIDDIVDSTKVFIFDVVQFVFSFVICAFGVIAKNTRNLRLQMFMPLFSSTVL